VEWSWDAHRLVVVRGDSGLREQLLLVVAPGVDRSAIGVALHSKLGDESTCQLVPVVPGLLRPVPDIPLVSIPDSQVAR
jgi:hypothetical protein